MRYRVNYEILGHMAFLSHLEMMRLWQRALLRSSLPVAWSQGFNPRPKLSLGPAKGVGVEGLSEYLDVDFKTYLQGGEVISKLNSVLPDDVKVLRVRELPPGTKLLEAVINEAQYKIIFTQGCPGDLAAKVEDFLQKTEVLYLRRSPKKDKELNLRSYVNDLRLEDDVLILSAKLGPNGTMRPPELLTVLGYWDIIKDITIQRLGLYIKDGSRRSSP